LEAEKAGLVREIEEGTFRCVDVVCVNCVLCGDLITHYWFCIIRIEAKIVRGSVCMSRHTTILHCVIGTHVRNATFYFFAD